MIPDRIFVWYNTRGLMSLWLYKENKLRDRKNVFPIHIPPLSSTHLWLISITHPRKILMVVLQIGKAKDLSTPLRTTPISGEKKRQHCCQIFSSSPNIENENASKEHYGSWTVLTRKYTTDIMTGLLVTVGHCCFEADRANVTFGKCCLCDGQRRTLLR
jgi:hypothetical protein